MIFAAAHFPLIPNPGVFFIAAVGRAGLTFDSWLGRAVCVFVFFFARGFFAQRAICQVWAKTTSHQRRPVRKQRNCSTSCSSNAQPSAAVAATSRRSRGQKTRRTRRLVAALSAWRPSLSQACCHAGTSSAGRALTRYSPPARTQERQPAHTAGSPSRTRTG